MFTQLSPMLNASTTLLLSLSGTKENVIRVTVTPVNHKDEPGALLDGVAAIVNRPFVIDGTAEELDAELPAALTAWIAKRTDAATTLSAMEKEFDDAKAEAAKRIEAERKKGSEKKVVGNGGKVTKATPPVGEKVTTVAPSGASILKGLVATARKTPAQAALF